ncbi:MAG: trigger factor [Bacteroidales bacterium]|jgi:trigger factor|nr:trigger factor [Bacteroidales bacterium]
MNINKEQIDDLNVVVSVGISKDDYESKVSEVLRDYRRKANMPGFRPGKVPEGLVRKMYGKAVLVDEINKLVSKSLQDYIEEQELQVLGEPMPEVSSDDLEWEIGNDFTFGFEMGLAPAIDVKLSKKDRITKYQVAVDQELISRDIENYASRYGQFVDTDAVVDFKERLTGDIVQLGDDGNPLQDGLSAEDSLLVVSLIKDEEHRKPFENARAGDEIVFNLSETFSNDWEIASILKKKISEEVSDISASLFRFTVKSIQKFVNAELNQELFDKVFGGGTVTGIEEFENHIKEEIATDFEESSMSKFGSDAREYLLEKLNPQLPEEFLRKWLLATNKEVSKETFEKEFPMFLKNMKWELIANAIVKQNELKVDEQEIIDMAKATVRRQFTMYGMSNIPDETLTSYAMNSLKDEKSIRGMASQVLEKKIAKTVNEAVDVNIQELSPDDFNKMIYASDNEGTKEAGEGDGDKETRQAK